MVRLVPPVAAPVTATWSNPRPMVSAPSDWVVAAAFGVMVKLPPVSVIGRAPSLSAVLVA